MTTAVQHFLGNLRRSLSDTGNGAAAATFRVTVVSEPFINKHIGDCLVMERVGQGAMSVMYKAKQDVTERIVAVKMLRVQLCCDPTNVKRFQREAKAISRLHHPNLLNVYHVGMARTKQPFIVLDFVEGRPLSELIAEGPIPWQRVVGIFAQICDGMQHAHEQGVIHRDLKPDNIMLLNKSRSSDLVKIVDFGIVKLTDESQRLSQKLTQTNEIWGSPLYMSPEQIQGNPMDFRTDIYSLGTVMYECLTGKLPFNVKNIAELVMKQLTNEPPSFAQAVPDVEIPKWLEETVFKALRKAPHDRHESMAAFKLGLLPPNPVADALAAANASAGAVASSAATAAVPATGNKSTAESLSKPGPDAYNDEFIGRELTGGYLVKSFIGEGGMSMVYKAVQKDTERVVAVKVLREELCSDGAYLKRFQREAKSLAKLSHPGLVSIYDVGVSPGGQAYMVIEYLEGKSLHHWLIDNGCMPLEKALPIFVQFCDVMNYAHKQGIIHRDVKPHNIMLVKQGNVEDIVKVVDFGIVKYDENILSVSQKLTASGEICGSPMYMSPEQILDQPLDSRTDIYSFGIVMYELLSGRPLFGGKQITEVMSKHVNIKPQPLAAAVPNVIIPLPLDTAVRKCLEKAREARFQSFAELKEELNRTLANLDGEIKEETRRRNSQQGLTPEVSPPPKEESVSPRVAASANASRGSANAGAKPFSKSRSAGGGIGARFGSIIALALVALICAGGAYAYWQWKQNANPDEAAGTTQHSTKEPAAHHSGSKESKPSSGRTKTHGRHTSLRRHESDAQVMTTIEKGHLEHNSGTGSDSYKGLP